jgi:catechol 2,3-dioxygenase-like lactoylglutathione lyase family enzyme
MPDTAAPTTPIQIKKLGHMVYEVSDIERSTRFWTEILGFEVSDRNEMGMVFLRNGTDHHSIALVPGKHKERAKPADGLRFHHLAMEVPDVATLFEARTFLREHGVKIFYEGRRGPGGNIGLEFEDPDGYPFEIYANMDQVGSDGKPRPPEQWSRAVTLEAALENPLPKRW